MRWLPYLATATALGLLVPAPADAQMSRRKATSLVIVTGGQATLPIPTLMEGAENSVGNLDVSDQLFLRLAELGPNLVTSGESDFTPALAKSWARRDSTTLAFDLDTRARWHDGTPVTARDIVFTITRAKDQEVSPRLAELLRQIVSVTPEGRNRVVFRFARPYAEQFYDATFHVAPLPAHLLDSIAPAKLATSTFAKHPIGSGPYRWVRSVPGQFIELAAVENFFLGKPKIERLIFRTASDATARLNLLLSGEADAMDIIPPPPDNIRRVAADTALRVIAVPSSTVGYLLFNLRDPKNRARPHPILADIRVRRAITLGLDRRQLVQAVFGPHGAVPYGPVSQLLWIRQGAPEPEAMNQTEARRLLASTGWGDSDGDGTLDRQGRPLRLLLSLPNTSGIRRQMALLVQEQLRRIGIQVEVQQLELPIWQERRTKGDFDLDFSGVSQDASPSGLTQSWSCTGANNVGGYCDRTVDSLMSQAILGRGDPAEIWVETLRRIEEGAPAVFMYAPTFVYAVNRRYRAVTIKPHSPWITVRKWSVSQDPVGHRSN
ncbi:MAG TPA: ABC transporter substrate-binding protein [Gemmatimonadales bacterium]|nr:ABC transporter substrate-binding protein [Gemmatimonadales bacterium]